MFDRLARFLFVFCAVGLAFFAGVAVMQFQVFPYEIIREAKNGLDAMLEMEARDRPDAIAFEAPDREPGPHITIHSEASGDEPLLITGGFFQNMEICPEFGCAAWISTRDGTILHAWQIDPAEIVEGAEGFIPELDPRDIRVVGTRLTRDGGLIASFHARNTFPYTVGIARLDRDSKLVWKRLDGAHHWFDLDQDENIYAPYASASETETFFDGSAIRQRCPLDEFHDDGIAVINSFGDLVRSFAMADLLVQNDMTSALYANRDGCDPFHLNSIEFITADMALSVPGLVEGDILISVREANLIAILSSQTGQFKYRLSGYTTAQHSPHLLDDGTIVVFDNQGGDITNSGTRVLRIDPTTRETQVVYPNANAPESPLGRFWSPEGGHIDVSPDGQRLMVSSKTQATTFEVDLATGAVLWSFEKLLDMRPFKRLTNNDSIADTVAFSAYSAHYLEPADLAFLRLN